MRRLCCRCCGDFAGQLLPIIEEFSDLSQEDPVDCKLQGEKYVFILLYI